MNTQREAIAAYRKAMEMNGAKEVRLQMATDEAIALAKDIDQAELRHPEKAVAAVARFEKARGTPAEASDFEGRLAVAKELHEASADFWDAFEGQVVDGVEIIRRRA